MGLSSGPSVAKIVAIMFAWRLHNSSRKCLDLALTNISVNSKSPEEACLSSHQPIRDQVCSEQKVKKSKRNNVQFNGHSMELAGSSTPLGSKVATKEADDSDNSNYYLFSCTIVQNVVINMVIDMFHKHNCITFTRTTEKGIKCLRLDLTEYVPGGVVVPWHLTLVVNLNFFFKFRVIDIGDRNLLEGYFHIILLIVWVTTVGPFLDLPEGRSGWVLLLLPKAVGRGREYPTPSRGQAKEVPFQLI